MTLFRAHRELLEDAMKTVVRINNMDDLSKLCKVDKSRITVEPYGHDDRINWDTYIVCIDGNACGFTNGPLK